MNKGFISIYTLILLPLILVICNTYVTSIQNELKGRKLNSDLHLAELYTIQHVINDLYNYEEENERITYKNYDIELEYEDITCYITILKKQEIVLKSVLQWDDVENYVVDYTYL